MPMTLRHQPHSPFPDLAMDLTYLTFLLAFFVLIVALARGCARLQRRGSAAERRT